MNKKNPGPGTLRSWGPDRNSSLILEGRWQAHYPIRSGYCPARRRSQICHGTVSRPLAPSPAGRRPSRQTSPPGHRRPSRRSIVRSSVRFSARYRPFRLFRIRSRRLMISRQGIQRHFALRSTFHDRPNSLPHRRHILTSRRPSGPAWTTLEESLPVRSPGSRPVPSR